MSRTKQQVKQRSEIEARIRRTEDRIAMAQAHGDDYRVAVLSEQAEALRKELKEMSK